MRLTLHIETSSVGKDWLFLIHGGKAHIGAIALAYPHKDNIHSESLTVPGHREEQLAMEIARYAAHELRQAVTVVMGIHIDDATKEEIVEIVESVHLAMKQELMRIKAC
ncbi:hypothetical protein [Paenibacillus sp. SI8]|uniref:prenylated flavin chaperone LpdD n=1 Tax=unclassified Paenibacillus TaxID=185978 RepID=UPI003465F051